MQTYQVRKSKNICFIIFHPVLDNLVQSVEFYPWRVLSSLKNFIHGEFYLVCRILLIENLIQYRHFYLVWRLLSSLENFFQCGDLYSVRRPLPSVETFIHCSDLHGVWRLLSSVETLIQYFVIILSCKFIVCK